MVLEASIQKLLASLQEVSALCDSEDDNLHNIVDQEMTVRALLFHN